MWIAGTYCPLWDSLVLWNSETIKAWERDTRSQVTAEHYRRDAVGFTGLKRQWEKEEGTKKMWT